jgi:hypothetical protein
VDLLPLPPGEERVPHQGFWRMPAATYHADPAPEPSLSSSIAKLIIKHTPAHARVKHPRLTPQVVGQDEEEEETDSGREERINIGSVAHEVLLGHGAGYEVSTEFDKWTTKDAKQWKADVIAAGKVPIKEKHWKRVMGIVASVRRKMERVAPGVFDGKGFPEVVGVWRDDVGCYGRCMIDWWTAPFVLWNLKTTGLGLDDASLDRRIRDDGIDLQCAWYERGVGMIAPRLAGKLTTNLVFVEQSPPHECRVIEFDDHRPMGERKAAIAAGIFAECLRTGRWPGYPDTIGRVTLAKYAQTQWDEREQTDPVWREFGREILLAHSPYRPFAGQIEHKP